MRLALDASAVIYAIEGGGARPVPCGRADRGDQGNGRPDFIASSLIRVEVRVKPIRLNDLDLLQRYDAFLDTHPLTVVAIDDEVIERATLLRAKCRLKTPDAIHLATAIERGADAFLTGDEGLRRYRELHIEVIGGPRDAG